MNEKIGCLTTTYSRLNNSKRNYLRNHKQKYLNIYGLIINFLLFLHLLALRTFPSVRLDFQQLFSASKFIFIVTKSVFTLNGIPLFNVFTLFSYNQIAFCITSELLETASKYVI